MKLLRKQIMLSEWIEQESKKLAKKQGVSLSELTRIALILLLLSPELGMSIKSLKDYEHETRKSIEKGGKNG